MDRLGVMRAGRPLEVVKAPLPTAEGSFEAGERVILFFFLSLRGCSGRRGILASCGAGKQVLRRDLESNR